MLSDILSFALMSRRVVVADQDSLAPHDMDVLSFCRHSAP